VGDDKFAEEAFEGIRLHGGVINGKSRDAKVCKVICIFDRLRYTLGMSKDFDLWNGQKKYAQREHVRPDFHEKEVWWCQLGANVGDEQDGKGLRFLRPILVVKKFNRNILVGIPLSTKIKTNRFYYVCEFKGREQAFVLSQIRLLDAKRLQDRMGRLPSDEFRKLKQKLFEILA